MIPRKFAPAAKVASPDDVKENEILTEIERPPKPAMTMEKRMQKKNKADNELVESSEVKKKPIQEQAFIPGWSKRPPGFHYVPRTGAVLNKVNLEETESFRKMTRSLSTEKTAEQTPLRALNILKNNLSKNAVFDADGNILATLPLAPCSTATSSRVRIRPAEKTVKGDAQPSRSTSRTGPRVLWRIGPKQETGTKKNDLTIPPVTYTEDRSNPKSNMSALAEAIRLAPGVSLWDGTNVFSSRPQAHSGDNSR
ncbi:unnamed protein product [Schistocephalus solidus]|uniref:EKA-like protein n=1 Tax=Schistocephalus solidus TaxID=70667 RepID=A0A183T0P6_SCHSO|nr:unnamed protein product [Schistocephalus solidus]